MVIGGAIACLAFYAHWVQFCYFVLDEAVR